MLKEIYSGAHHRLYVLVQPSGRSPVEEFLIGLPERDRSRMWALIKSSCDNELPLHNREKCKLVEGYKFYEFKTPGQRIIWCWLRGQGIALLHGFTKRQDRIAEADLNTANARYDDAQKDFAAKRMSP